MTLKNIKKSVEKKTKLYINLQKILTVRKGPG